MLGLLYLLEDARSCTRKGELGRFVVAFISANPGVAHPISDRWAVSLFPAVLTAAQRGDVQVIRDLLRNLTKWIADRYDSDSLGLSATDSSPQEEVDHLLGDPFEHVKISRRPESYLATAVLDIAAILRLDEEFNVAINEFLAVQLFPTMIESPDTVAQYVHASDELSYTPHVEYAQSWKPEDRWKVAPHHKRAKSNYYLQRINRYWDHLALSSVLRNRHYLETCRHFLVA